MTVAARHEALRLRARLYTLIRDFFAVRNVLEVETPILSAAGNTEPNIDSFTTRFSGHVDAGARERYLRTSPEYPLKRLLAEGLGDCYELGRVFRNGEAGKRHNPEFSMLEWYRVGMQHRQLAEEVVELVLAARNLAADLHASSCQPFGGLRTDRASRTAESTFDGLLGIDVHTTTYRDLFLQQLDLDPFTVDIATLQQPLANFAIDPDGLTRDDWLDLLLTHRIQPHFQRGHITVIHDWPATQCALARIRPGDPPVAERFELYFGPHELANGYHELHDADEQRARFENENRRREQRGQSVLPLDENLLAVLDAMPDCSGVALGIERLMMCLCGTDAIADVMAFPFGDA